MQIKSVRTNCVVASNASKISEYFIDGYILKKQDEFNRMIVTHYPFVAIFVGTVITTASRLQKD